MLHDLRYGVRTLLRTPLSTAVMILSLAVGIGVNVTVFTAYKAFFLRPLDAQNSDEMVNVALKREGGAIESYFSYPDYEAYRESARTLAGLAAYRPQRLRLSSAGAPTSEESPAFGQLGILPARAKNAEFAMVYIASENFFRVFGVNTKQGRSFDSLWAEHSVLISENFWQRRFASDPGIIGRTIRLNQVAVTIAGIAPRDFTGANIGAPAFWMPASLEPLISGSPEWLHDRANRRYRLFGRLAPDIELAKAEAEFNLEANRLRVLQDPQSEAAKPSTALVWPGSPFPVPIHAQREVSVAIFLIMFAALMVLAVASANAGCLQLARIRVRETEIRTRLSLGATRLRVIRQLLTESALTAVLAGAFSFLLSWLLLKGVVKLAVEYLPVEFGGLVFDVNPNLMVFTFVVMISLTSGTVSGIAPAIRVPRTALVSSDRVATGSARSTRLQNALVALQVALSLVLMITGAMFVRGAVHAIEVDPGFDSAHVATLELQFPGSYSPTRKAAALRALRERIAALPGVDIITSALPPGSSKFQCAVVPIDNGSRSPLSALRYTHIQSGYFETLGVPLLAGEVFSGSTAGGQFVVLSESAAKQVFGRENPLGRGIRLGVTDERFHPRSELVANGPEYRVLGVVRDTKGFEYDGSDSKQVYLQVSNESSRPLLIRTKPVANSLVAQFEAAAIADDPEVAVVASTLESALRGSPPFVGSTLAASIASTLGALGSLIALIGVFATVSNIVALRTREVGIRIAVGAGRGDVLGLILGKISRPVIAGLACGTVLASAVYYILRDALYGVNAVDGLYFGGVALGFLLVTMLASLPPANRATRIDPMEALRCE